MSTRSGRTDSQDQPTDKDLLSAHVHGDPNAFGEVFRRHQDRMWAVALRTLRDPEEAADAVQQAAISAFRHADGYRGDAAVTTWLHRIVVNACLDRIRRRAAKPTEPLPEGDRALVVAAHRAPDDTERRQAQLDISAALETLNPDQRAALVLVDMLGYSVEDAAQILQCAPGTVKSRCARGRARLAPRLAHLATAGAATSREEAGPSGNRAGGRPVSSEPPTDNPPGDNPPAGRQYGRPNPGGQT